MQFGDELIKRITEDKKDVTRRLAQHGDYMPPTALHKEARTYNGRLKFREDETYAICNGRGKPAIGRLHLKSLRKEKLHDITEAEAKREGFASVAEFRAYWDKLYSKHNECWEANPEVYRLEFRVVAYPVTDDEGNWIPLPQD